MRTFCPSSNYYNLIYVKSRRATFPHLCGIEGLCVTSPGTCQRERQHGVRSRNYRSVERKSEGRLAEELAG